MIYTFLVIAMLWTTRELLFKCFQGLKDGVISNILASCNLALVQNDAY
jgi:hypothetical protein